MSLDPSSIYTPSLEERFARIKQQSQRKPFEKALEEKIKTEEKMFTDQMSDLKKALNERIEKVAEKIGAVLVDMEKLDCFQHTQTLCDHLKQAMQNLQDLNLELKMKIQTADGELKYKITHEQMLQSQLQHLTQILQSPMLKEHPYLGLALDLGQRVSDCVSNANK